MSTRTAARPVTTGDDGNGVSGRTRWLCGAAGLAGFVRKFRVYDINDQDGLADWLRAVTGS